MKHGLVMQGGAMRGLFTAGVIDVLMENNIAFDAAVGVSAGAAFGCNYKSRQIRRAIRYNTRFCRDKRYCSAWSLIRTGDMFGAEFCYHTLPEKLDMFDKDAFNASPMDFWVVCTDITTGKAIYHKCGDICYDELEWIRASASLPLAARVVEVGGHRMLDGGIADVLPLRFMESRGCERNVVILTQPRDYVKQPTSMMKLITYAAAVEGAHVRPNDPVSQNKGKIQKKSKHHLKCFPTIKKHLDNCGSLQHSKKI